MRSTKPFVGIDLGGTNMQIGVVSHDGKLLGPAKRKTKADEGLEAIVLRIISGVEEACERANVPVQDLGGIGIGAPGVVDPFKGVVIEAVNLRWDNVPIADILTKRLKVKTWLDNDVNVAVYGENRMGVGKGSNQCLGIWVGTGIGGGLILNGKLHYGHFLSAGEIGHTVLYPGLPRGNRTLENHCSRTAVVHRLVRLLRSNAKSKIIEDVGEDLEAIKSRSLGKHYLAGDRLVVEVIDHTAQLLGVAIANAVTLLSLERVILGGGLTEAVGKPFVDQVTKSVRDHVFPDICKKVEIVASQLADNAGVFGAAMIARERRAEMR